jgi:hypothetical protein
MELVHYHKQRQQQQLHGLGLIDLFSLHLRNFFHGLGICGIGAFEVEPKRGEKWVTKYILSTIRFDSLGKF